MIRGVLILCGLVEEGFAFSLPVSMNPAKTPRHPSDVKEQTEESIRVAGHHSIFPSLQEDPENIFLHPLWDHRSKALNTRCIV